MRLTSIRIVDNPIHTTSALGGTRVAVAVFDGMTVAFAARIRTDFTKQGNVGAARARCANHFRTSSSGT